MFALLAMSKTIADRFSYASVELFQKLKLYPIQASDKATHTSLTETSDLLQQLKLQDEENKSFNKDSNSQQTLLSDIICPKIFRLTYNKYGKGFGRQPINSSSESG
ncbi:hypothetical protein INT48_007636 [Thamnidium elegans]|uniref:Uncharacterized protein n=1 Tax=Thamnidium elegans TaxID=101142 RepID=A0A8H7SQE0_9FUNG|nr:hypothetical protein INT48_007636 [Thamnidium elegans]